MSTKILFFQPLDVLIFRDHRPFDAGLHHHAHGIFPAPSVLLGCLRTALFLRAGANFRCRPDFGLNAAQRELLGDRDRPAKLRLRGPLLATRNGDGNVAPYFAPPQDVTLKAQASGNESRTYQRVQPTAPEALLATTLQFRGDESPWSPERLALSKEAKTRPGGPIYLTRSGARKLLGAEKEGTLEPDLDFVRIDRLYQEELRTGICRDKDTLTVEEHMLYSKATWRLAEDAGFAVEVEADAGLEAPLQALHQQVVTLGGKGHRARIHVSSGSLLQDLSPPLPGPQRRAWFITPAVLEQDPRATGQCAAVVMETPQLLGGWDLARRCARPLRRAAPVGTVLFLDAPEEAPWRLLRAAAPDPQARAKQDEDHHAGHGVALLGSW